MAHFGMQVGYLLRCGNCRKRPRTLVRARRNIYDSFFRRVELTLEKARVERHLAAILAADVAGYSRLMGTDEVGTLARLRAHRRERVDPAVARHNGRIVKTT